MRNDDVLRLLEPAVSATGVDLEDLEISAAGRRRRVRVIVDADGGVDLDKVAAVSHAVSEALDASEVMGESPYVLEVTSPGVDRPLTLPRHWRRNVGRLVECELADGSMVTGRVESADDEHVLLAVADARGAAEESRSLAMDDLVRGRVQIEFSRPTETGE